MENLQALIGAARETLDAKYQARETALAHGRALTRTCANAIRSLHRGEFGEARTALDAAGQEARRVAEALTAHPDLYRRDGDIVRLSIHDGDLLTGSLTSAGFASGAHPDWSVLAPLQLASSDHSQIKVLQES